MRRSTLLIALCATTFAFQGAGAVPPVGGETSIDEFDAAVADGVLLVQGFATYGGEPEVIVATDPPNDWADDEDLGILGGPLGIDVLELALHRPDLDVADVEFVIKVAELHVPPPNEVIRYLWQFVIGEQEYWVQAKMSDALSGTTFLDDPEGALANLDGAFRLRGDCQVIGVLATCVHLMWIDGVFDLENNEVRMRVPLDDPRAPHFTEGAVIGVKEGVGQMTASIQVLISNTFTSDNVTVERPYTIAQRTASFALVPVGSEEAILTFDAGFVGANGAFSGEVPVDELDPGEYELHATVCFGVNCGTRVVEVQL